MRIVIAGGHGPFEPSHPADRAVPSPLAPAPRIAVLGRSFEDLPFEDNRFDVIWSQDSLLHSGTERGSWRRRCGCSARVAKRSSQIRWPTRAPRRRTWS